MQLGESTPNDYILITGLTTMVCIAFACFAFLHGRAPNMLLYKNGRYIERKLSIVESLSRGVEPNMRSQAEQINDLTDMRGEQA
jgi:hypothetical protein